MAFVWTRNRMIAATAVGLALVGGGVGVATALNGPDPGVAPTPTVTAGSATPDPTPSASPTPKPDPTDPLTGGEVSNHEVIAVKVENIAAARPQIGLAAADIVFAEEVEGAQTRLVAIYHTTFPTAVEPVRSARNTDVQLLGMFGRPGLVYSGANSRVQRKIDRSSIVPIYRETRDRSRVAPHNVRVDLAAVAKSEKAGRAQSIGWMFAAADDRWDSAAKATTVKAAVGHDTFGFTYTKGRYLVRWNGQTYADGLSGKTTTADNVVVMTVRNHADGNRDVAGSASVQSDTVGRGKVAIYRNGKVLKGTWSRAKASGPMKLTDGGGRAIPLEPGQTWVALHGKS